MQTFNHTWRGHTEEDHNPALKGSSIHNTFEVNLKITEWWPTYLSVACSLSLVQLHSGGELGHLPRPELLSRRHVDQILHHCVTVAKQVEEKGKKREWMKSLFLWMSTWFKQRFLHDLHVISQAVNSVDHVFSGWSHTVEKTQMKKIHTVTILSPTKWILHVPGIKVGLFARK